MAADAATLAKGSLAVLAEAGTGGADPNGDIACGTGEAEAKPEKRLAAADGVDVPVPNAGGPLALLPWVTDDNSAGPGMSVYISLNPCSEISDCLHVLVFAPKPSAMPPVCP